MSISILISLLLSFPAYPTTRQHSTFINCVRTLTWFANWSFDPRAIRRPNGGLDFVIADPEAPGFPAYDQVVRFARFVGFDFLGHERMSKLYESIQHDRRSIPVFQKVLEALQIRVSAANDRIPREGGLVLVAPHTRAGLDGVALAHVLSQTRTDFKILIWGMWRDIPELQPYAIFMDNIHEVRSSPLLYNEEFARKALRNNVRALREATAWVNSGGALIVFPSGAMAWRQRPQDSIDTDPPWDPSIGRIIVSSHATVVPVYIPRQASSFFSAVRRNSPTLSTSLAFREVLQQRGQTIELLFGEPARFEDLAPQDDLGKLMENLRQRCYSLGQ